MADSLDEDSGAGNTGPTVAQNVDASASTGPASASSVAAPSVPRVPADSALLSASRSATDRADARDPGFGLCFSLGHHECAWRQRRASAWILGACCGGRRGGR